MIDGCRRACGCQSFVVDACHFLEATVAIPVVPAVYVELSARDVWIADLRWGRFDLNYIVVLELAWPGTCRGRGAGDLPWSWPCAPVVEGVHAESGGESSRRWTRRGSGAYPFHDTS